MKTNIFFASIKGLSLVAITVLVITSCNTNQAEQTSADPAKGAARENDIKFDNKKLERDAQFLVDATAFNLEQIQLANLGVQKGNAEVKKLSNTILAAHTKTLKEASDLANKKQVTVPDSISTDAQQSYDMLNAKSGNDFDKPFCERLVDSHKKAVNFFEMEAADSRDMDLKEWATTKLPDTRKHLDNKEGWKTGKAKGDALDATSDDSVNESKEFTHPDSILADKALYGDKGNKNKATDDASDADEPIRNNVGDVEGNLQYNNKEPITGLGIDEAQDPNSNEAFENGEQQNNARQDRNRRI